MTMNNAAAEIPRDHWLAYFNDASKLYQGWGVTIEVLDRELGDQPAAKELPLQGLSFEAKGGSMAGDILVEVGDIEPAFETHHVDHPRAVWVASTQPGGEADIRIESDDGTTTLLRIRRRPELPPVGEA